MGQSQTSIRKPPSSKAIIKSKMELAAKTGVLNLSDCNLKASSHVYTFLWELAPVIKTLDLSGNTMKVLPNQMELFTSLKSLHLSRCYIQRSRDMSSLPELQTLKFDSNDFESDSLAPLPTSLLRLDLGSNHCKVFPLLALDNCTLLVELKLNKNRIENLEGISVLVALETLVLDDNKLTGLCEEVGLLPKLRLLNVRRNLIAKTDPEQEGNQSIHPSVFTDTNLINIDLEGNVLSLADAQGMDGVEVFMKRRKKAKDKSFSGGAMTDMSVFGLI